MSKGNRHVHREMHKNSLAFTARSETCEWPSGCTDKACWYYTTARGRFSLCNQHTPLEYRTDPIHAEALALAAAPQGAEREG